MASGRPWRMARTAGAAKQASSTRRGLAMTGKSARRRAGAAVCIGEGWGRVAGEGRRKWAGLPSVLVREKTGNYGRPIFEKSIHSMPRNFSSKASFGMEKSPFSGFLKPGSWSVRMLPERWGWGSA